MTDTQKHTPGPWMHEVILPSGAICEQHSILGEDGAVHVAEVHLDDGHCDSPEPLPAEANARLIAAAPDLLAALEDAAGLPDLMAEHENAKRNGRDLRLIGKLSGQIDAIEDKVRAAIAKARGQA